ncbi:MAG TPA: hypothetical protein VHS06_01885, partial [Chloroflexota bacterium]|nr:hypothetical protein [Chloroflexota bacterium]
MHHYVFSQVEEALDSGEKIAQFDSSQDSREWATARFRDGQLIRAVGLVRLMDYSSASGVFEVLPKLQRMLYELAVYDLKRSRDSGRISVHEFEAQRKEKQKELSAIKDMPVDEVAAAIRQLYGDAVR